MSKPDYWGWWHGKRCLVVGRTSVFKLVTNVEWVGPPSMVYGIVRLTFEDGTTENVAPMNAYRPRKIDVIVATPVAVTP